MILERSLHPQFLSNTYVVGQEGGATLDPEALAANVAAASAAAIKFNHRPARIVALPSSRHDGEACEERQPGHRAALGSRRSGNVGAKFEFL